MSKEFSHHTHLFLVSLMFVALVIASTAFAQNGGQNLPGMAPPSPSPTPAVSPEKMDPHMNMPGMPMPASSPSPNPQASPEKMDPRMNMSMPSPSPAANPAEDNMKGMDMSGPSSLGSMKPMNMGPLMVMNGSDVGIRVGASDTNLISMGAMGSGTSWQPSSAPLYMLHKQSGDWLLMFHYNLVAGVNRQGGPRGVTKAESANWFMPMAYHKLALGTLQLRSMFSFEPFTFPPGGSPLLFQTGETYKGQR